MSLARIARALGVSVTTVSRALSGYTDVAEATRARVAAEAARIGYRPNQTARRLRSGRAGAIGVVLPAGPGQFDDPFFLRLLGAIGPALEEAGLDLIVTTARPGADELRAHRALVEGRKVDGILLARTRADDARITWLLDQDFPFAAHGRSLEPRPFPSVDIDGEAAFRAATDRLIAQGHTRIALINAPTAFMFARHRAAGWRAALAAAALPEGPSAEVEATEESGHHAMRALLAQHPTAVLCATDRIAVGALHALAEAGLRAGRDLALIGYDDLPLATYTDPPLTTVAQPIERAAHRLVEMLLARIDGAPAAGMQEIWPARLIPRRSDGPPPMTEATTLQGEPAHEPPQPARL